ncbi:hypothetical protein N7471_005947 [Penicillium samsonianum]|uniref:uncharacterized protein n=1 Tax=Penicillium samsonianum TaxID=1882272 RepID=UPI00254969FC|nr:uncharacterized protein N7471_005947 [Penicillium samsonianum]KAJ6139461.1 hypothetical protein N7471_005947 [Penicillium samsonianum]
MGYWLFLSVAVSAFFASASAAPSKYLSKRETRLRCRSQQDCVTWYTTGSALCPSGYELKHHKAPGDPVGTYCERKYNDEEKKECASEECAFYTGQCNNAPASTICGDALRYCGTPVKISKRIFDKNAAAEERYLRYNFGESATGTRLFMTCTPVTPEGAEEVDKKVLDSLPYRLCDKYPYGDPYEHDWKCKAPKNKFDSIEKTAKAAYKAAAHPGDKDMFAKICALNYGPDAI